MVKRTMIGALALGVVLAAGPAWALSEADTGTEWMQAPTRQRIQVANVLSRQLGGDPLAYVKCLDETFAGGANATMTIQAAAQECRAKQ